MEEFFENIWKMIVESNVLQLIGALLLLLVGWLVAVLLSNRTALVLKKFEVGKKLSGCIPEDGNDAGAKIELVISRIVFFVILLITILGCFSVLKLNEAAQPITSFVDKITNYAANIIGAALLTFIAWVVATVIKFASLSVFRTLKLDDKLAPHMENSKSISQITASTIYYVVFLLFLPAILRALKIEGITDSLEKMMTKILEFIPNLIAAAAILILGLFVAKIVRKAVSGLSFAARIDELGSQAGCGKVFGEKSTLSQLLGLVSYVLVAIPVIISSLTALKIDALTDSVSGFFNLILNATGNVIGAAVLLFVAFLVGGIVSGIVVQLLESFGFNKLITAIGVSKENATVTPAQVAGKLTMITIMFLAAIAACNILEFTELAGLLRQFLTFGGNILLGIVVMLIGIFLANVASDAVSKGENTKTLSLAVKVIVLIFTGAIALNTMQIGGAIVTTAFTMVLGAICVAAAVAFGIGGRELAARKLNEWSEKFSRKQ